MAVSAYQKKCFAEYKEAIKYPADYTYLYGNPLNVMVPIETTLNKVMIVGAYPSAKFFTVRANDDTLVTDTPVADNDSPFSNEQYFDGSRVRTIPSGKELNEVILDRLGIDRSDCWITDLVKVFLFKPGHVERYKKLGKQDIIENRTKFKVYAKASLQWIYDEINICNPSLIILLGAEVTEVFFEISNNEAIKLLDGSVRTKLIGSTERQVMCIPHPGILMKRTDENPWPKRFEEEISVRARMEVERIRKTWNSNTFVF